MCTELEIYNNLKKKNELFQNILKMENHFHNLYNHDYNNNYG